MNEKISVDEKANELFSSYFHYYVRTPKNVPVATIAIGKRKGTGKVCRGISICSEHDNFNRRDGYNRAVARMIHAALNRCDSDPIHDETSRKKMRKNANRLSLESVNRFLNSVKKYFNFQEDIFKYKEGYNVETTPFEDRIMLEKRATHKA